MADPLERLQRAPPTLRRLARRYWWVGLLVFSAAQAGSLVYLLAALVSIAVWVGPLMWLWKPWRAPWFPRRARVDGTRAWFVRRMDGFTFRAVRWRDHGAKLRVAAMWLSVPLVAALGVVAAVYLRVRFGLGAEALVFAGAGPMVLWTVLVALGSARAAYALATVIEVGASGVVVEEKGARTMLGWHDITVVEADRDTIRLQLHGGGVRVLPGRTVADANRVVLEMQEVLEARQREGAVAARVPEDLAALRTRG